MSTYSCSICMYSTNNKYNLKKHINNTCSGANVISDIVKVKCEICNKEFDTKALLKQHVNVCFNKKAIVVTEYIGKENIDITINTMMKLIELNKKVIDFLSVKTKNLEEKIDVMQKEIDTLKAKKKSKESSEKRAITEEDLEDGDIGCSISKTYKIEPTSYKFLKIKMKEYGLKLNKQGDVNVSVKGNRSEIEKGNADEEGITINDIKYYYEKTKKEKCVIDTVRVVLERYCQNDAQWVFEDERYCTECMEKIESE